MEESRAFNSQILDPLKEAMMVYEEAGAVQFLAGNGVIRIDNIMISSPQLVVENFTLPEPTATPTTEPTVEPTTEPTTEPTSVVTGDPSTSPSDDETNPGDSGIAIFMVFALIAGAAIVTSKKVRV